MTAVATHAELSRTLSTLRAGVSASELHGSITGFLCAGGLPRDGRWLHALALDEVDAAVVDAGEGPLFDSLFQACAQELEDPELAFGLLLPDDDTPIDDRAVALVDWCRGFLGGMGVSGADVENGVGAEGGEVMTDLARIAATRFDAGDTAEDDEEAYAEVVEYVRVGVLLLHSVLGRAPDNATRH